MSEEYEGMDVDRLFELFREAAINNVDGPRQEAAVDDLDAIKREIAKHPGFLDRYRSFLSDPEASVRYSAAISLQKSDPEAVLPVFKEIRDGRYGISDLAWIQLRELRLRGFV